MKSLWLSPLLWGVSVALRLATLNQQVKVLGNIGGIKAATSLCIASMRQAQTSSTTWIPLLEESPATLQNKIAAYGPDIYPYTTLTGAVLAQSDLFAPGAINATIAGDGPHYTGYGTVGATCSSWNSAGSTISGAFGVVALGDLFFNNGTSGCNGAKTIICVEVPRTQQLMPPTWMFTTNQTFTADLGGLAGADNMCTQIAKGGSAAIKTSGSLFLRTFFLVWF